MAAAEEKTADLLECGCCYENDDLKRLPCSPGHIFCVECLVKDSAGTRIIRCPQCRYMYMTIHVLFVATLLYMKQHRGE